MQQYTEDCSCLKYHPCLCCLKYHPCLCITPLYIESPGEIKREVSWTLTKKLDAFAGPGEIKTVRHQIQEQGGGAGLESWTSFASVVFQRRSLCDCSAQQLGQQLRGAVVAAQCRADTALIYCFSGGGPRQPWSSGLAPVSRFHSSVPLLLFVPVPNRPTRLGGR